MSPRAILGVAIGILAGALAFAPLPGRETSAPGGAAGRPERPDDPPAPVTRAAQPRAPSALVVRGNHRSVQVNVDGAGNNIVGDAANEPSLAIDPVDPDNIVIGWRQFDSVSSNFRQAGYAYSHDGGTTWTFPGVLQPGQFRSDPVLAADSDGTFFYYSLNSVTAADMFVSEDAGLTWSGPFPAFGGDKPWMTVDTTPGLGEGNVYAIWNNQFTCCAPGTDFTRSTDGGLTYEGPLALPVKARWGTLDVGPDGTLWVVGATQNALLPHVIQSSPNAGNPDATPLFRTATYLILEGLTVAGGTPNPGGLLGQVWVAVDRSAGPTSGNVYVVASVDPPGEDPMDVMFVRSTDGGQTWSPPLRLNDDAPSSNAWQWFATLSVAPNGRLDVVWNDTRNDPSGTVSEVFYAWSTDAGRNWSAGLPVTPPFNSLLGQPNQNKIGDYYHMISDADSASLAYAATFNGEQDVWFLRLGDCNANGRHDAEDVRLGSSGDCNANRIPDECEGDPPCAACDDNGTCAGFEDCENCPGDCITGAEGCGNAVCEPSLGEDCLSCPEDCNGVQSGPPAGRFCCGDGGGDGPVGCGDARCSASGFACSAAAVPPTCCGDGACEGEENEIDCAIDCGALDSDSDGVRDLDDCAPFDPAVFSVPGEVGGVLFPDRATLSWSAVAGSGSGTTYDVLRGAVEQLPVGTGPAETCVDAGVDQTSLPVGAEPPPGAVDYYLVRGANACGEGSWGSDSFLVPRSSTACGP